MLIKDLSEDPQRVSQDESGGEESMDTSLHSQHRLVLVDLTIPGCMTLLCLMRNPLHRVRELEGMTNYILLSLNCVFGYSEVIQHHVDSYADDYFPFKSRAEALDYSASRTATSSKVGVAISYH